MSFGEAPAPPVDPRDTAFTSYLPGAGTDAERKAAAAKALLPGGSQYRPPAAAPSGNAALAGAGAAPANSAIAAWVDALFQHYLGRPASATELSTIQGQGWTPDRLRQHLRAQPSYIPGLTMGSYEDTVAASKSEYLKYLGYEPSDADIRDLNQRGYKDQFAVNNYLKNRPDVVALHPGAPIDLADEQWGHWKDQTDAHYQQNLQRVSTDVEARDAYNNRQTVAPPKPVDIGPGLSLSQTGGLQAKDMLSPSARAQGT